MKKYKTQTNNIIITLDFAKLSLIENGIIFRYYIQNISNDTISIKKIQIKKYKEDVSSEFYILNSKIKLQKKQILELQQRQNNIQISYLLNKYKNEIEKIKNELVKSLIQKQSKYINNFIKQCLLSIDKYHKMINEYLKNNFLNNKFEIEITLIYTLKKYIFEMGKNIFQKKSFLQLKLDNSNKNNMNFGVKNYLMQIASQILYEENGIKKLSPEFKLNLIEKL